MKVITIGRGSENDVSINVPQVSRHHCQIVQHDNGTFSIVDFGSTNGTYVNGRRIYEQVPLKRSDRVQIAQTELSWQRYFPNAGSKSNNRWLWPTIGSAVAVMVLAVVLVLWLTGIIGAKEILYDGPEPPIATVTLEEDGVNYDVEAAEGQLIVMFDESVSHRKAVKILKNNSATIIAQIPDVHYYLVEVPSGKESELFSCLRNDSCVDYVYPKMINVLCSATPYIFDNFSYSDHGKRVVTMLGSCNSTYKKADIGLDEVHVSGYTQPLIANLKKLKEGESAVINMSFGPGLIRLFALWPWQHRPLWNDHLVTEGNQESYKRKYINELKQMIKLVDTYDNKDFVIVKSAGNEGMKEMELIIDELQNQLSPEEYAVFERHFIVVSANDDNKEGDYPNDVKNYHKMVTKVDISDMTAQDLHWQGTSFSAPRVAGFITSVANSHDMKVTEVLEYVRKATEMAPDHILTQELLEKVIEGDENGDKTSANEAVIEGVLKMYLLDNMRDGSTTYYLDTEGNVEYASAEEEGSYSQGINRYRSTNENEYIAFVVETDKIIDVRKYLDDNEMEFLDKSYYSAFMVVPNSYYLGDEFAAKYANKRVRVTGTLYVPGAGWRNATEVVMDLREIVLIENKGTDKQSETTRDKTVSSSHQGIPASLVGTKWLMSYTGGSTLLEFVDNYHVKSSVKERKYIGSDTWENTSVYDCYYDTKNNHIVFLIENPLKKEKEEMRLRQVLDNRLIQVGYFKSEGRYRDVGLRYFYKQK